MHFWSNLNPVLCLQGIIFLFAVVYEYYTWRTKIPLVPTQMAARKIILAVLQTEIEARRDKKVKIYDLGSGLGGLCLSAAKKFPAAEVVGLEMAWPAWLFSMLRQKLGLRKNVRFRRGNFWTYDISDGDIVMFYLGDVIMAQMSAKLRSDARANRLVVSNTFPLPKDWVPVQRIPVGAWLSKEIIVYRQE